MRLQEVTALIDILSHYANIEAFLEELAQERVEVTQKLHVSNFEPGDALSLATVHAAKGLEWESVFVIGLVDGWFPHGKASDVEEERRIFHVAITRARRNLGFTFPERDNATNQPTPISRFLSELPIEIVENVSRNPAQGIAAPPSVPTSLRPF